MGADAVVIRHGASGAPHRLANAGWVRSQRGQRRRRHPRAPDAGAARRVHDAPPPRATSTGRRVTIVGDVLHSRVARSNVLLLAHARRRGDPGRAADAAAGRASTRWPVQTSYDLDAALAKSDAVMMLRVQHERMNAAFFPSAREYSRRYGLDARRMARLPDHAIVMHPGPMNRGMEIAADVADSARSVDRRAGHQRRRRPDGGPVPAARRVGGPSPADHR